MKDLLAAAITGLLFGAGLLISDMTNPERVLAFLDVAGAWDPTLAWVMAAALLPMALAWRIRARWLRPVLDQRFHLPTRRKADGQLLLGAALFGVGWGMVGLCPGPALAGLTQPSPHLLLFVAAMLAGMALPNAPGTRGANPP